MAAETDFVAYGSDGRPLVVETKVRPGVGNHREWGTVYRENLLASEALPRNAWFLLATPEVLYLWKPDEPADAPANWEVSAESVFRPYLSRAGIEPSARLHGAAFEMVVASWLRALRADDAKTPSGELFDVLRARLRHGLIVRAQSAA